MAPSNVTAAQQLMMLLAERQHMSTQPLLQKRAMPAGPQQGSSHQAAAGHALLFERLTCSLCIVVLNVLLDARFSPAAMRD